jgi:Zn-dependent protease with chaperone function
MIKKIWSNVYALFLLSLIVVLYASLIGFCGLIFIGGFGILERVPIIGISLVILSLVLGYGIFKGLKPYKPFGVELKQKEAAPKLVELIEEIAKKVGTKTPNRIIFSPHTEIGVYGVFRRTLILGVPTLRYLNTNELKAILAHELGHFGHADTKIGVVIGTFSRTLGLQRQLLHDQGLSGHLMYVIVNWISYALLTILDKIFSLFYSPFSKSREYLADQVAVEVTSSNIFSTALLKYAVYARVFSEASQQYIIPLLKEKKKLINLYQTHQDAFLMNLNADKLEEIKKKVLEEPDSLTHPSIKSRITLEVPIKLTETNPACTLIKEHQELEKLLTEYYTLELGVKSGLLRLNKNRQIEFVN